MERRGWWRNGMLSQYFLFPVFAVLSELIWILTLGIVGRSHHVKVLVILDPLTELRQRIAILKPPVRLLLAPWQILETNNLLSRCTVPNPLSLVFWTMPRCLGGVTFEGLLWGTKTSRWCWLLPKYQSRRTGISLNRVEWFSTSLSHR